MKSYKQLISSVIILMFVGIGSAAAQTCYDPYYGYYECQQGYYNYPDQGQAFIEGAFLGAVVGGFYNNNGNYNGGGHWNNHGNGNWNNHGGGGVWHGGGGHGGGHGGRR